MKFEKGDKVKILAVTYVNDEVKKHVVGKQGIIINMDKHLENLPIYVKIDDIYSLYFNESQLESTALSQEQVAKHPKCPVPFKHHQTNDKKQYGHPEFYKLLEQMADLHSRKNHDYAGTKNPLRNLKASERINVDPFIGVMIRLQDKWSRLESFLQSGEFKVKDESVEDTLMDNAVYSLLAIILRREQKNKKPV